MDKRLTGLVGIARRAGHTLIGFDSAKAALHAHKAQLVLLAADCSPKTEKELRFAGQETETPIRKIPLTKSDLSAALGLEKPVAVLATDDRGFAAAMLRYVGTDTEEDVAL